MKIRLLIIMTIMAAGQARAAQKVMPCTSWSESMAAVKLKNAGYLSEEELAAPKISSRVLAFQKVRTDLYREVFYMTFTRKNGVRINVITRNDMTPTECSGSGVEVFMVSKTLGAEP
ncbi:hypothetical protein LOC54_03990 [Acetobacter sp. AN02]|uniref:hypothetical protein n=1 Tax=Acetobacter sp. AN02 TaxID=2894186 RepID=UPI00243452E7|nr:hypothetical protein [Acetobacter sp. AN02]MDG6094277.1 hypothetical protein [Acetobacter sp. AN02]